LGVIAGCAEPFESLGTKVWISSRRTVSICNDKYQTYRFFRQNGIRTPKSWLPGELDHDGGEHMYPMIVKPVDGVSSVDVFRVDNAAELGEALRKVRNPIVQEYVEGTEYTIDVVADDTSRPIAVVPRERIEVKAGISYKGRTVRDPQLIEAAGQIAQTLEIRGPCNIQCRVHSGEPSFFEINPRFSGTLPLTVAAGVNSPLLLLKLALHQNLEQSYYEFREGVYMARYWMEVFYDHTQSAGSLSGN